MKIDDIARLAGVSKSAVSLAFHNKPGVSEETRQHILDIAQANGYVPRTLKQNRHLAKSNSVIRFVACKNLGIVTEQYDSQPFFNELIHHLTGYAREKEQTIAISSIPVQSLSEEIRALEREQPSAGLLLLGTDLTPEDIESVRPLHAELVVLDTLYEQVDSTFVSINNYQGGYQAGKYMASLGHRQIGYVESESRLQNFSRRKAGFLAALAEEGLSVDPKHVFALKPMLVAPHAPFGEAFSALKEQPTAIFCENDYMAISAIKTFQEMGLDVPHDVSVMGFDDIREATVIGPELTTVRVRKEVMARTALDLLLKKIEGQESGSVQVLVNTEIVPRRSCR